MLDNYDSFTWNLVHLFEELGAEVEVFRNDAITVEEAEALAPDRLVVSPGPGPPGGRGRLGGAHPPARAALSPPSGSASATRRSSRPSAARSARRRRSCTARRAASETTARASSPSLPEEIEAGRYHSLAAVRVPDELTVTARTEDGEVMAVRHRAYRIEGVQFHPESVLTPDGPTMAANFLR